MKKAALAASLIFMVTGLYAQNLDYRQVVFGNSYESIEEISTEDFFKHYPQAKEVEKYGQGQLSKRSRVSGEYTARWGMNDEDWVSVTRKEFYFRVYEQKIGEETFYRLLCARYNPTDEDLLNWKRGYYEQQLLYKINEKELLHIGSYTHRFQVASGDGNYSLYQGVEIIERKGKVIGVLPYMYYKYYRSGFEEEEGKWEYNHSGMYALFEEVKNSKNETSVEGMKTAKFSYLYVYDIPKDSGLNIIRIRASDPLIDEKRPFMYTLQNAFDGNPATSYVENTEDDLMSIGIYGNIFIRKLAIINGFAENDILFFANNRIKEIASEFFINNEEGMSERITEKNRRYQLQDNQLFFQIFEYPTNGYIFVTDLYRGKRYTDTCVAEIDVHTDEFGWLFGGTFE